jgi:hypothetical protein
MRIECRRAGFPSGGQPFDIQIARISRSIFRGDDEIVSRRIRQFPFNPYDPFSRF